MEILIDPVGEEEVLSVTDLDVPGEKIMIEIEEKAQSCVNHLCGCGPL